MLSYMPGSMPRHEPVAVSHIGFKFRGKVHANFGNLIRWFKVTMKTSSFLVLVVENMIRVWTDACGRQINLFA